MLSEKTVLIVPGKKLSVPRVVKRSVQVSLAVAVTAAIVLGVVLGNGLLIAKGSAQQGLNVWLAFVKRPDILATMILTASVTVALVYWQRKMEKR